MMRKRNVIITTVLAFVASMMAGIMINQPAHAEMAEVAQKWIFSQYYHCLQGTELTKEINRNNHKSGEVASSIFPSMGNKSLDYSYLPSEGYFTSVGEESISCYQVLRGIDGKISGILEAAGASYDVTWDKLNKTDDVLNKLGYKSQNAEDVVSFKIIMNKHVDHRLDYYLNFMDTNYSEDLALGSATIQGTKGSDGHITWKVIESNLFNSLKVTIDTSNKLTVKFNTMDLFSGCDVSGDHTFNSIQLTDDVGETKKNILASVGNYYAAQECKKTIDIGSYHYFNNQFTTSADVDGLIDQGNGTIFTNDGSETTALKSLLSLGRGFSTLKLSEDERYNLYLWYLKAGISNLESSERLKCQKQSDNDSLDNGLQELHLKKGNEWYKYYVNLSNVDLNTAKYRDLKPGAEFTTISLQGIIDWMNSHNAKDFSDGSCDLPDSSKGISGTTVVPDIEEVDCWNAAGALGWILCPVIDFAQHTITAIYDSIVENFLEFRAEFLEISGDNAIYTAWQTFQSIANVGFVIVLLVVIFSQLTGIGIDNLGIKRILPKLIVAAVLINLSYLICMLFVDISNILGVGLNNMFSNIIVTIDGATVGGATGAAVLSTVMTAVVGAAVGALAFGAVAAGISGSVIVLPLVLGLIATLIGVLFFFILLGVRQALIIILIVVSPVAVACYMLPNTKSIFNKWLKLFEALLLLFPICGLIMGGSAFASDILMTMDTGFLGKLIAMLVGVVPFFFIPSLLKSSMAAAGNIGAKISGVGQAFSRGTRGKVANSQWAKDYQARSAAGIDRNGKQTALGKWRSNIASGKSRFSKVPGLKDMAARAQARGLINYEKMRDELDFASRPDLITSEAVARRFSRQQAAEDAKLVNSGDVNRTGDFKDSELTSADVLRDEKENKGTLTYDFMQAVDSGNEAAQYAIIERMLANGHHGAQSYRNILKALEMEGNTKALMTAAKAGKNSRHVGDLKGGARSVFDYINGVTNGDVIGADGKIKAGNTLDDYVSKTKFANMSEAQLFNTDNEELARQASYVNDIRTNYNQAVMEQEFGLGRSLTAEEQNQVLRKQFADGEEGDKQMQQYQSLISQAQKAYNNPRLRGQAKESRQNLVADIAGISQGQRTSQSINIPREDNSGNSGTSGNSQSAGGEGGKAVNGGSPSPSEDSSAINIDHSDSDNSTKQITGEQLQQMARQYNNQSGPTGRGNVSDEDLQRNIARLQRKQNPTLQESEMLNALYNEQGVRANIREANRDGQNNNQA